MIKKFIEWFIILSVALSVFSCNSNSNERVEEHFEENVASDPRVSSDVVKPKALVGITDFDSSGNEISKQTYTYNEFGILSSETLIVNGVQQEYIEYIYNENQLLIEKNIVTTFAEYDSQNTYKYKYDDKNNVIVEQNINSNGDIIENIIYEYDEKNRIITKYDSIKNTTVSYTYSEHNSYSVKTEYEFEGEKYFHLLDYEYDRYGNLIHQITYKQNSLTEIDVKVVNTYNNGLIISSHTYVEDNLCDIIEYEYSDNLIIKKTHSDIFGVYMTIEYFYNEYNDLEKVCNKLISGVLQYYTIYTYDDIN